MRTALWDFNSYCHCVIVGSVLGFAVMSTSAPPVAQYVQCWLLRFFFFFFFFFFFYKQNCNINTNVKKNCTRIKLTKHLLLLLLLLILLRFFIDSGLLLHLLLLHFNYFPSSSSFYLFVWLNFLLSSFLYQEMSELTWRCSQWCARDSRGKNLFVSLLFLLLLFEKPRQSSPTGCPRHFLTRLRKIGKEIQGERRWEAGRLFHNKVLI